MDSSLVVRAQQGDRAAFADLVDIVGGRLHAIACSVMRDRELARDAIQQTLLTAWQDLPRLRDPDRFEAWTCRILVRNCRREGRRAVHLSRGEATRARLPASSNRPAPAAESPTIDPADFGGFSGTRTCDEGTYGEVTELEWGSLTAGETYPRCSIETSDPRINGNSHSIHNYFRYDSKPRWGVRNLGDVITNSDGTWVLANGWGFQRPEDGTMRYTGEYRGTGAYEGLTALMMSSQDAWGLVLDIEGVIIPGGLPRAPEPPPEEVLAAD